MKESAVAPCGAAGGARPFAYADDAWFWTMAAVVARRDGAGLGYRADEASRPCDPEDVLRCLDRLYRAGRISNRQVWVMRIWGEAQRAPDAERLGERESAEAWAKAMGELSLPLLQAGIIDFGAARENARVMAVFTAAGLVPVTTAQTSVCG